MSHSDDDAFSQLGRINDIDILPPQLPSQRNTLKQLLFSTTTHNDSDDVVRIVLRVDASPGCGGIAWPAGEVLSRYVASRARSLVAGKSVIELGSGTGLVGLVAASAGAGHVWITDQAPLLDIMRTNVGLNELRDIVDVIEYNWGCPKPEELPTNVDLILAADCVYFEPAFPLLVTTLCDLAPVSSPGTDILFCYKKRRKVRLYPGPQICALDASEHAGYIALNLALARDRLTYATSISDSVQHTLIGRSVPAYFQIILVSSA